MKISVAEIVRLVEGSLLCGSPEKIIQGFEALQNAEPDDLSFFGNPKYHDAFVQSKAGAILVTQEVAETDSSAALIAVENPTAAFDVVVRQFGAPEIPLVPGVHPTAFVAGDVELDDTVGVGPNSVVLSGCRIGAHTWIGPNVTLAEQVIVGSGCRIYPQVAIREGSILGDRVFVHSGTVIGADGYGYELLEGRHEKILQAGIVEIEDDVEIGANVCIDRARFGATVIGEGTKIDNLVQIGHNVRIGKHCLIISQAGISGSTVIGDYVTVAARAGIAGHLTIGDRAILAGKAGVIRDVPAGSFEFGYPSMPKREWAKQQMYQKKVPGMLKRIADLEERLRTLEDQDS